MKYTKLILDEKMIVPEPKIRLEFFLHAIVTGEACELKPKTVDEEYLYAIATGDTSRMSEIYPRTLVELYYDAILNNSVEDLPTPRTRWEEFLRSAVTKEPCELEPETSLEIYLSQISSNGGFDYIVSTSTNSTIISLPNSINGTIKSIEMDGNTLVNYCTNGSEELTLNNEINAQGTNVTLTDTVNNGKVDVMCEGNTLVNLFSGTKTVGTNLINFKLSYIPKKNTLYTVIFNISYKTSTGEFPWGGFLNKEGSAWRGQFSKNNMGQGLNMAKVTTQDNDDLGNVFRFGWNSTVVSNVEINNLIILEGDYTNKPIPSYFEGMKSVGECEDNKVEIVGQSKNLCPVSNFEGIVRQNTSTTLVVDKVISHNIPIDNSKEYIFTGDVNFGLLRVFATITKTDETLKEHNKTYNYVTSNNLGVELSSGKVIPKGYNYVTVTTGGAFTSDDVKVGSTYIAENLMLCSVDAFNINNDYVPHSLNKKEIQLSEPLRGVPGGVCDKFVKQGGKWYVERNCGERFIGGNDVAFTNVSGYPSDNAHCILTPKFNNLKLGSIVCDRFPTYSADNSIWMKTSIGDKNGISTVSDTWGFAIRLLNSLTGVNKTDDNETVISKFKTYLKNNPITVIYQLATPTYEEITDPQVITYLDTTHISTNSTIPCDIQIKNSGYNAIIKPSTKYTIALDTDKSGKVNIGLGGAKTSTTNGVVTITTPSTLTDDSLTLYGKDIKVSNVRLLEGDKTNYIPNYFEGMKSCFEDKEQDNGSYKMEILSNNANLFNIDKVYSGFRTEDNFTIQGTTTAYNTSIFSRTVGINTVQDVNKLIFFKRGSYNFKMNTNQHVYITIHNSDGIKIGNYHRYSKDAKNLNLYFDFDCFIDMKIEQTKIDFTISNIMISINDDDYVPHKSNSIQLQLNEPLRAVGDVKDRFVLRDGKLMIERNCGQVILNGEDVFGFSNYYRSQIPYPQDMKQLPNGSVDENNKLFICDTLKISRIPVSQSTIEGYYNGKNTISGYKNGLFFLYIFGATTINLVKQWLLDNPTKITYQLAEPTYEEVPTSQRLTCYENATLFIDTNITPTHVEIEYPTEKQQLFRIK